MIDSFEGDYSFLSNFYPSPIMLLDMILYPTVEHYFQAQKTNDLTVRKRMSLIEHPGAVKKEGKKVQLRSDWDQIRIEVMTEAVRKKFENPELRKKLLATGEEELIEGNWWGDQYWGVCKGVGENHLGKILMQIREELRK